MQRLVDAVARRWLLWPLSFAFVAALLLVTAFLAHEYQDKERLLLLEESAAAMSADVRAGLNRGVQNLQALHSVRPTVASWPMLAADVLGTHREMVHLEWRGTDLRLLTARTSPYWPHLYANPPRQRDQADVVQACAQATRLSGPAYAPSYFWPLGAGQGVELMELCLPLMRDGQADGFLVATYAMPALLTELIAAPAQRGQRIAWTAPDATRLAIVGQLNADKPVAVVQHWVDLPGVTYLLRLERTQGPVGWLAPALSVIVAVLALGLFATLGLLMRDLRRRVAAERQLADALAVRKAMEDSLVTGLRARDMEGRITYVNPAFCQMVGLSAEQLLGSGTPAPYWPADQRDEYRRRSAVRWAGKELPRRGFESEFVRPDGSRFAVLIIEAPLINAQGVQTGWMSAILDMSEQRRMEELARATQERLQASARLALVGEMASLVSHELNQPLAAIASYASGAINWLDDPAQASDSAELRRAVERIQAQAERAGRVIRSVSDWVRRRDQPREAVSPQTLFASIEPLLQLQARQLQIALEVQVAPACPKVWCDRTLIEQVLLNLCRNGMQAMPLGEPSSASGLRVLCMSARPVPASASRAAAVELAVADHGSGISQADAQHLFTPFFTTKSDGMGLGLNLCRTVVEQHGGMLHFGPHTERGTVFWFDLPPHSPHSSHALS